MLTGVPLVMGKHLGKAENNLVKIGCALYRPRPVYVLVLRIVLVYVVAALGYVYEAMPPCPTSLGRTQRVVDRVLTRALQVPRNVPWALMWMPVSGKASASATCIAGCGWGMCKGTSGRWTRVACSFARTSASSATPTTKRAQIAPTRSCSSLLWRTSSWRCTSSPLGRRSQRLWTSGCTGHTSWAGFPGRRQSNGVYT